MQHDSLPPVQLQAAHRYKKPGIWVQLRQWAHHHPRKAWFYGIAILLGVSAIATIIVIALLPTKTPSKLPVSTLQKPAPVVYYSPLTGREVASEAATKQAVTGIMIENSPDARPQSGLKQAGIVYEAVAEGGITRFLALYQEGKPGLIGPVRSVRMYYVDWVAPYNASVAHIGGSAAALAEVRGGNYRDIDQFFNAPYYWRATDRYAPHNVYTSFEKLDALNAAKGYKESTFTAWPRKDGKPAETPTATSVAINFSGPLFNTQYTYDKSSNTYLRSIGGVDSNDREEGRITPSVVIAMKVNMVRVLEDGYRESIQTTGSGEAIVFQNGIATTATWHKASRASSIIFTGSDGKEIPLARGQTWIAAVPNGSGSVSWQ